MSSSRAPNTVVTPGNHDGVHLGHQALLQTARQLAGEDGTVVALTFDPHPSALLAPANAPVLLTTLARRQALLRHAGADRVEVLRFDHALASLSPEQFVRSVLTERLGIGGIVVGPDFRFGRDRAGDLETLHALGAQVGFEVRVVNPVTLEGDKVSSTRIRNALERGEVGLATRLLGHVFDIGGQVVRGDQRGRTLGFPTANLACEPVLMPSDGVYAVITKLGTEMRLGVANIGVRPTVGAGRSVEVHLLDFEGDLNGADVRIGFVERLRGERRFEGLDALKAQIEQDVRDGRARLANANQESWTWM